MNPLEIIMPAIVAMALLSVPVLLGFLLYSALSIRKDFKRRDQERRQDMNARNLQNLRKDMNREIQELRKDFNRGISEMNARLDRIEGRLFGGDEPSSG